LRHTLIKAKAGESMAALVARSIAASDPKLRPRLYANVVVGDELAGDDQVQDELRKLAPADVQVKVVLPPMRKDSAWIGGSIVASLSTFAQMWTHDAAALRKAFADGFP
jgi:actin-related protein